MKQKFSVLMSLYIKEKPENLKQCLDSLLNQTVKANEWVVVKDGPLTAELNEVLRDYIEKNPNLITIVELEKNKGLGLALREGIIHCKNELVARMDTDDIAIPCRFEKQLREFQLDDSLSIVGSHIREFENSINNVVSERIVPLTHSDIVKYQKRRSAFNHMTVMFKKTVVIESGNYQHALMMEDDLLWVHMILNNAQCKNVDDYLVYARIGLDMIKRRGGFSYFKRYASGRKVIYQTGFISRIDYFYTLICQLIVSMMPEKFRLYFFKKHLRKK